MATYKGKYTSNANGLYDLELYEDSTVKETATNIELDEVKSRIIVWVAQDGYTKLDITSDKFTPDMDNFDSLYCL
tara:strand:- start:169 stop:393 length:225 start_codon:yes stop_codon:yes gene_type:complete